MGKIVLAMVLVLAASLSSAGLRFSDNGDGTVMDRGSGLVWQKCSCGMNALDCSGTAATRNWQEALLYCRNLSLAGKSWRLPSVNELGSIVDYSRRDDPRINSAFFPNTVIGYYWTSTSYIGTRDLAWIIMFIGGISGVPSKSNAYYVRCVTDGP